MGKMLLLHQVTKNICIIFGNTFSINEDKAITLIESVVNKENLYTCTSLNNGRFKGMTLAKKEVFFQPENALELRVLSK